ncbi:MAG: 3-hydroxyacyl-ACP dehydratase FabZ [Cyanobacteria bacterium SIG30]|nr:3-hydroxyacyl-ACP dehydratase FabZ [Cyanobacteria bacterium SIG30]
MSEKLSFDIMGIQKLIPHRYPFLLVDRITECVPGEYSKGYKNLSMNESFFQGHFPGNPIMPGVLQIEALAQCSAPILLCLPEYKGKLALFAGIENAKFKNIVRPGDRLDMEIYLTKLKGPFGVSVAKAYVDGKLCTEAIMKVVMVDGETK